MIADWILRWSERMRERRGIDTYAQLTARNRKLEQRLQRAEQDAETLREENKKLKAEDVEVLKERDHLDRQLRGAERRAERAEAERDTAQRRAANAGATISRLQDQLARERKRRKNAA